MPPAIESVSGAVSIRVAWLVPLVAFYLPGRERGQTAVVESAFDRDEHIQHELRGVFLGLRAKLGRQREDFRVRRLPAVVVMAGSEVTLPFNRHLEGCLEFLRRNAERYVA